MSTILASEEQLKQLLELREQGAILFKEILDFIKAHRETRKKFNITLQERDYLISRAKFFNWTEGRWINNPVWNDTKSNAEKMVKKLTAIHGRAVPGSCHGATLDVVGAMKKPENNK